jgi:polyhydroxyalkanoate synthesis regulator phasin
LTQKSIFDEWKARGEEVLSKISSELMSNEHFLKAMQGAMKGKEKIDQAASRALKQMNIPTRTEFKKAMSRIESLEAEISDLKHKAKAAKRAPKRRTARKAAPKPPSPGTPDTPAE